MAKVELELQPLAQAELSDEKLGGREFVIEQEQVHDELVGFFVVTTRRRLELILGELPRQTLLAHALHFAQSERGGLVLALLAIIEAGRVLNLLMLIVLLEGFARRAHQLLVGGELDFFAVEHSD